jgi:hypothetical protein
MYYNNIREPSLPKCFFCHLIKKEGNTCVGFARSKGRKKYVREVCVGKTRVVFT